MIVRVTPTFQIGYARPDIYIAKTTECASLVMGDWNQVCPVSNDKAKRNDPHEQKQMSFHDGKILESNSILKSIAWRHLKKIFSPGYIQPEAGLEKTGF